MCVCVCVCVCVWSPRDTEDSRSVASPECQAQVVFSQDENSSEAGLSIVSLRTIGDNPLSGHVSPVAQVCCPGDKGRRQSLRLQEVSRCWVDAGGPG